MNINNIWEQASGSDNDLNKILEQKEFGKGDVHVAFPLRNIENDDVIILDAWQAKKQEGHTLEKRTMIWPKIMFKKWLQDTMMTQRSNRLNDKF